MLKSLHQNRPVPYQSELLSMEWDLSFLVKNWSNGPTALACRLACDRNCTPSSVLCSLRASFASGSPSSSALLFAPLQMLRSLQSSLATGSRISVVLGADVWCHLIVDKLPLRACSPWPLVEFLVGAFLAWWPRRKACVQQPKCCICCEAKSVCRLELQLMQSASSQ